MGGGPHRPEALSPANTPSPEGPVKHSLEIWPQAPAVSGKCHMFAQREDSKETSPPGANATDVPSSLLRSQRINRLRDTGSSDGMDSFRSCARELRQDGERALGSGVKTRSLDSVQQELRCVSAARRCEA